MDTEFLCAEYIVGKVRRYDFNNERSSGRKEWGSADDEAIGKLGEANAMRDDGGRDRKVLKSGTEDGRKYVSATSRRARAMKITAETSPAPTATGGV